MHQVSTKTKPLISSNLPKWAHARPPVCSGCIKTYPEDFIVKERLGFELSGEGEHVWIWVQKIQQNTQSIARLLASQLNLPIQDIGYAGLKDKQAVTQQWFSVLTPKNAGSWEVDLGNTQILCSQRHHSKLKRGAHRDNDFQIIIRDISNRPAIERAVEYIRTSGVPNYFGEQRFGHSGQNIVKAAALFDRKLKPNSHQRGIYLSAARALLFNQVLSERVQRGIWNKAITGDVMILSGSNSFFKPQLIDETIIGRIDTFDIHPSAPLWGRGNLPSSDMARALELDVLNAYPAFTEGLTQFGLRQQRRATRLMVRNLEYEWLNDNVLKLNFRLHKGTFATTVLRELLTINA